MVLDPLSDEAAFEAIERRIEHYSLGQVEAPVTPQGFDYLYQALHRNLRDALSAAQEFALWLYSEIIQDGRDVASEDDRRGYLEAWLAQRAEATHRDASGVQQRHWQFFVDLCTADGRAGSSEFERFDFNTQQQFTAAVTSLAQANLMVREIDPDDGNRTLNSVTALGWLVYFFRNNFEF
jgi:hypothetical protein